MRKKTMLKRAAGILMTAVLALQLTACGGSAGGAATSGAAESGGAQGGGAAGAADTAQTPQEQAEQSFDAIYTMKPLNLGDDMVINIPSCSVKNIMAKDGKVYAMTVSYSDFGTAQQILSFNEDGSGAQVGDILSYGDEDYLASCFDGNGRLYLVTTGTEGMMTGVPEADPGAEVIDSAQDLTYEEGPADEAAEGGTEEAPAEGSTEEAPAEGSADEGSEEAPAEDYGQDLGITPGSEAEGIVEEPEPVETEGDPTEEYTADIVEDADFDAEGTGAPSTSAFKLACFEADGSMVWETSLSTDDSMYYVNQIVSTADGLVLSDSNGLSLYSSEDGSLVREISRDEKYIGSGIYATGDGQLAAWYMGDEGEELSILSTQDGSVSKRCVLPSGNVAGTIFAGSEGKFYLVSDRNVSALNLDDGQPVEIINFLDSDIDILSLDAFAELGEGRFITAAVDAEGSTQLAVLEKVDPEVAANRQVLTLGCYQIDYEVRRQVLNFNKTSTDSRIKILDYSQYDTQTGTEGLTRLNTDIASGNAPDIMLLSASMPLRSYIAKGVLEDLTPYFDGDGELQNITFLNNVMDAFRTDGKMYTVVPAFYVLTLAGLASDIGDPASFDLQKASALAQEKGTDISRAFGLVERDTLMYNALQLSGDRFIDLETGECYFDGEEFVSLLEFMNQFPGEIKDEDLMEDTSADYRSGKSLFYITDFCSYDDYSYMRYGVFGADLTMTGFPSEGGSHAAISPQLQIAMSSAAKDKDVCWQFMRSFLTDEYQQKINTYYWPVNEGAIDELAMKAMEPKVYDDGQGNLVEEPIVVNIGGEMISLPTLTMEEADQIKAFLRSIDKAVYSDAAVENIIMEEAAAFFAGQKNAQDVADVIQSRVQIYLRENE
ncbi:MAG: extracellular solute-binding protein [Lachnospiraceae bacterium]|nr:extracellular solute-binding protein [Lachnospiraceae bacterium]